MGAEPPRPPRHLGTSLIDLLRAAPDHGVSRGRGEPAERVRRLAFFDGAIFQMNAERVSAAVERIRSIETDVSTLRRTIAGEELEPSDRQYLSRCFDLLDIELAALRQYLVELP